MRSRRCAGGTAATRERRQSGHRERRPGMQIAPAAARASARYRRSPARRARRPVGHACLFPLGLRSGYSRAPNAKSKPESARPSSSEETAEALWYVGAGAAPKSAPSRCAAPGAGRGPRARALRRHQPRHRSAGVRRPGSAERISSACARRSWPAASRFRSSTATPRSAASSADRPSCAGAPCSRCIRTRAPSTRAGRRGRAGAGRRAAGARGACRQHGDGAQRGLGCGAGPGRPHRGGRRGRGRRARRLSVRPACRAREVTLVDVDAVARASSRAALGVDFAAPDAAPADCDLVIHASGTAAGLATALRLAGDEATVLELSWYGDGEVRCRSAARSIAAG